ncbi:nitrate/nitrite transporter [Chloroflexota bacterium]
MIEAKKPRFFWGYVMVAAGFLAGVCIIGQSVVPGVIFKPISQDLGWTRAATSWGVSIAGLVSAVATVFVGRLTDKHGPRMVLIIVALAAGLGNILASRVTEIWQYYLFYSAFAGVALSGADVPIVTTISRWFVRRRGTMIGLTKAGAGVGIIIFPMLTTIFVKNGGWRSAYLYIGIIVLIGVLLAGVLFRRDPTQMNQLPDGDTVAPVVENVSQGMEYSVKDAIASRQFRTFAIICAIFFICVQVVMVHLVNHITDLGISDSIAASVLSVIGFVSIIGRVGLASLSDRLGPRRVYLITLSFLTIAILWLQFAQSTWMFYLFGAVYGLAHGGCFALLAPMLSWLFGVGALGTIMGLAMMVGMLCSVVAPLGAGWIFDLTGSYQIAFVFMLIISIIAVLLMFSLKSTKALNGAGRQA